MNIVIFLHWCAWVEVTWLPQYWKWGRGKITIVIDVITIDCPADLFCFVCWTNWHRQCGYRLLFTFYFLSLRVDNIAFVPVGIWVSTPCARLPISFLWAISHVPSSLSSRRVVSTIFFPIFRSITTLANKEDLEMVTEKILDEKEEDCCQMLWVFGQHRHIW